MNFWNVFHGWVWAAYLFLWSGALHAQVKSLSFNKVVEEVKKANLQTRRASLEIDQQKVNLYQAKGARIPTLTASANQNYNFGRSIDPFSNQFVQQEIRSNNFNLMGSVELFNGFRVKNQIIQQEHGLKAQQMAEQRILNEQLLNALSFYLQGLMSQEQLRLAKSQLSNLEIQLERARIRRAEGLATPEVEAQLLGNMATAELSLIQAQGQLHNAKIQLLMAMNAPIDTSFVLEAPEVLNLIDTLELAQFQVDKSVEALPQIKEAEWRIRAAYQAFKVSKGAFSPRLTLNAGMSTVYSNQNKQISGSPVVNSQFTGFVNNDPTLPVFLPIPVYNREVVPFSQQLDRNWSQFVQLQLTVPILSTRNNRAGLERSKISQQLAINALEQSKNQAVMEVEQSKINYLNAKKRYETQTKRLQNQSIIFKLAESRFVNGTATAFEFSTEQNVLNQVELEQVQAKYELVFRGKILEFYRGTLTW